MKEYLSCQLSLCFSSLSERGNLLGSIRAAREHQPPTTKQWRAPVKQIINISDENLMQYSLSLFLGWLSLLTSIHIHFLLVSGSLVLPNFHFRSLLSFGTIFSLNNIHITFTFYWCWVLLFSQTKTMQASYPSFPFDLHLVLVSSFPFY